MDQGADNPKPDKGGRPPFVPTPEQRQIVMTLAGTLTPHDQIARFLSIGLSTLKRHFRNELDNGRGQLLVSLKQVVCRQALNGSVRAATWLIERLDPQFVIRRDLEGGEQQTRYIVVKNSLPDMPGPDNNWGADWVEGPKPDGEDRAPTDADVP